MAVAFWTLEFNFLWRPEEEIVSLDWSYKCFGAAWMGAGNQTANAPNH